MKNETLVAVFFASAFLMAVVLPVRGDLELDVTKAQLNSCRATLQDERHAHSDFEKVSMLNGQFEAQAYQQLLYDFRQLQTLHQESMQWGPLRSPRDCVREIILMNRGDAYPVDDQAEMAYLIQENDWLHGERTRLYSDLEQCEMFKDKRFDSQDPKDWAPHQDSSSIYPE